MRRITFTPRRFQKRYLRITWEIGWWRGVHYSARPHLFLQQASGQIFKGYMNCFSTTWDFLFMSRIYTVFASVAWSDMTGGEQDSAGPVQ
jgi:hypothetical protein